MCSWFRLIQQFMLFLLFSALPGLLSANSVYYVMSDYPTNSDYFSTSYDGTCSLFIASTGGYTGYYDGGTVCHLNAFGGINRSMSPRYCGDNLVFSDSTRSCQCADGYQMQNGVCTLQNSCINGVTVAGSGYPPANPGYSGVGSQITYCSSDKCVVRAWESLVFSACPDDSTSCSAVRVNRSEGTLTGDQCTTPSLPSDPQPQCAGGMTLQGGQCVCPAGARIKGGVCRQNIDCSAGYHRVNDSCIADACPSGEIIQDNKCVPDPRSTVENTNPAPGEPPIACAAGRHYDVSLSSCVANTAANGGTSGSPGTPGNPSSGSGGVGGGFPGESGSAESSDCAQPPVCAGDAVQCALLTQVWRNHCDSVPQSVVDAHPVPPIESVDLSTSAIASLNAPAALTFVAVCPADKNFSIMGQSYVLSWQPVCDGAAYLKPLIIAIGFLHGLYVVFSIRKGE